MRHFFLQVFALLLLAAPPAQNLNEGNFKIIEQACFKLRSMDYRNANSECMAFYDGLARLLEDKVIGGGVLKRYLELPVTKETAPPIRKTDGLGFFKSEIAMIAGSFFKILSISLGLCLLVIGLIFYLERVRSTKSVSLLKNELKEQSLCLESVTDERDWLIKEIHHRVKNNLQIVLSLLNTQSSYLTDMEALKTIRNSQYRMFALSLVHQKLYQAESLSNIDMVGYTHELVAYLQDAYQAEDHVDFTFDMVPLELDVNIALPFGLIINEAINNTLKYAFPKKVRGEVKISLSSADQYAYNFSVTDNGIGLNGDAEPVAISSFGRSLMAGLANQIGGTYEMKNGKGVEVIISFNKAGNREY